MPDYTVNEVFHTFQGEGVHMGRAALFVRLQGCDQTCSWCDSAGTWHPRFKPKNLKKLTPVDVWRLLEATPEGTMLVLTGGEPCLYDLDPLIEVADALGRLVAIETAGHRPLPTLPAWITLSPKPAGKPPLMENVGAADEFKVIVTGFESLWLSLNLIVYERKPSATIWLHPEWSHHEDPDVLELIVDAVKRYPELRAGWQLHKNYRADLLDPFGHVQDPVPLGGVDGDPY